jgi:hypothetical protein
MPDRKLAGRLWTSIHQGGQLDEPEKLIPSVLTDDVVFHNVGSSMGNVSIDTLSRFNIEADDGSYQIDPLRPTQYPLHPSDPRSSQKYYPQPKVDDGLSAGEPTIRVVNTWRKLCVRPAELYLGSITQNGELSIFVSWDKNTYEESVVEEWLKETKSAAYHFFCQPL